MPQFSFFDVLLNSIHKFSFFDVFPNSIHNFFFDVLLNSIHKCSFSLFLLARNYASFVRSSAEQMVALVSHKIGFEKIDPRCPFLTSPPGANFDPQGQSCPPGVNK
jgi:hypothetical protein